MIPIYFQFHIILKYVLIMYQLYACICARYVHMQCTSYVQMCTDIYSYAKVVRGLYCPKNNVGAN